MRKGFWMFSIVAGLAVYVLALYAGVTGELAWFQTNAMEGMEGILPHHHLYYFQAAGMLAYGMFLAGLLPLMRRGLETATAGHMGISSHAVGWSLPVIALAAAGFMRLF